MAIQGYSLLIRAALLGDKTAIQVINRMTETFGTPYDHKTTLDLTNILFIGFQLAQGIEEMRIVVDSFTLMKHKVFFDKTEQLLITVPEDIKESLIVKFNWLKRLSKIYLSK